MQVKLGIKEIEKILPHRHPFLLVDCITELEPGVRAEGYKAVSFDESYFRGMPGVLIIEALAQTGAVAILSQEGNAGRTAYFGAVDHARFRRKVVPGDRLRLVCEIEKVKGPVGKGKATAYVEDEKAVEAELTFILGK